jgi:signal peptidase
MKKAISIIIVVILLPVLFVNSVILIDSLIHPDEVPSFFGWKPFIILSGSMESEIMPGDIAIVKEVDTKTLKVGDVIAFKNDDLVITHRIKEIKTQDGKTKYITKGDNNNTNDFDAVMPDQVEGIYVLRIPNLGNLAIFIQTPIGMLVGLSIPLILLILLHKKESMDSKKELKEKTNKEKEMEEELNKLRKQNEELKKK